MRLAAEGRTRIALFGAGRHTKPIVRQPWARFGIEVVVVFDDSPGSPAIGGVPVVTPDQWLCDRQCAVRFDALVVSSAVYELEMGRRAMDVLGPALEKNGVPIVSPYTGPTLDYSVPTVIERLVASGIAEEDARWLAANRDERHDATLQMIAPERTEFHLRRYELAADILGSLDSRAVADIACGVGYGARMLTGQGNAEQYTGVDLDLRATEYAERYHRVGKHVEFVNRPGHDTEIEGESVDLVSSFETIEHVEQTQALLREFSRVLKPGGTLVISTPNALGPTPYHVHDFGFVDFERALSGWFQIDRWYGQLPVDEVFDPSLPPGIFELDLPAARASEPDRHGRKPHALIAVCSNSCKGDAGYGVRRIETRHGPILLQCPNELARWRADTFLSKEPETLDWIDDFEDGDVFWDIGANIGLYSLYAAAGGRAKHVLSFEPSPWNAALLSEHIRINGYSDRVGVYTLALAEATCPDTLFMRNTETASAGSSLGEPVGEFGERFDPIFRQAALGVRIDDFVAWGAPAPTMMKIDVDGTEERVLAGAAATLASKELRSVSIELDDSRADLIERVTNLLSAAGLGLVTKLHAGEFAVGRNASIYNYRFDRLGR
jgi:FkbM family methyltransferase